ncbi:MAG: chromosome segregation SMC family protein [Actinomycetota bacterium]
MFLKSLVIRGFKSFAEKTTLVFEPGITIVVGPNGSGKSNVIDAISWVLGEQGPRSLRGGKMEDVIFAGSPHRPALGMTEVALTIDNSAGLLPIEFAEVTISRLLFRSGESEYRLNGAACRLLDIQEVLSDTGVGREQHTIVGQGQLDDVLNADPEQLRGFIEEAAGVGKHRRRKERAGRKIIATEQNIIRLSDLLSEVRRQLRPLREQADAASRFSRLSEELARTSVVSAARGLAAARAGLGPGGTLDLDAEIQSREVELKALEARLLEAETRRREADGRAESQREAAWSLARSGERLSALSRLAEERLRALEAELAVETEATAHIRVNELRRQLIEVEESLEEARIVETAAIGEQDGAGADRQIDLTAAVSELDVLGQILDERSRQMGELLRSARSESAQLSDRAETVARVSSPDSVAAFVERLAIFQAGLPAIESGLETLVEQLEVLVEVHAKALEAHRAVSEANDDSGGGKSMAKARRTILEERLASAERALELAIEAVSTVEGRQRQLGEWIRRAGAIGEQARNFGAEVGAWASQADQAHAASRAVLDDFEAQAQALRIDRADKAEALDDLRSKAREEDLGRTEVKLRARILEEKIRGEWNTEPDEAVRKFGHRWEFEDPDRLEALEGIERIAAMDDHLLDRRKVRLERELGEIGRVNPLAAQEFEALGEREEYLSGQLMDLRASRRDLVKIVESVDEKIKDLFVSAFEEVGAQYERLFSVLFPGGRGRLTLTDPADLLNTGVEVEARPGGKNIKRLSLLSGGERALSALAVLFAIFRARPSPFYILDEVEAALDDVNLHRFLGLLNEFRDSSQLLVVTHQKRTMEVADVLYGVSIGRDGASRVISERMAAHAAEFENSPTANS